jgi:hypothetical protein
MDIQDSSAAIYSEAKSEYTKQLVFNFQPVLLRFFLDRFNEVKNLPSVTSKSKSALSEFQDSLSQIPEWNLDKVRTESTSLLQSIHCDYIEELITAVFIAHTKILSAIRLHSKPRRKINITVPKPDHFMHRAMSESSRLLWSNVYLFSDSVSSLERQKNMNDVNRFLEEGILQAIRNLLPVKSILRDSLHEDEDDGIQLDSLKSEEAPASEVADIPEVPMASAMPEVPIPEVPATEVSEPMATPMPEVVTPMPLTEQPVRQETLVIDTERSVGFTGIDSVFGTSGEAELRPSIEESEEMKILGDLEELDMGEIEDLDVPPATPSVPAPLSADDYESI